jgi:hypothetical protein
MITGSEKPAMVSAAPERLLQQLVGGHDARDQPGAFGFGGIHQAGSQAEVHRLGLAHGARQALRAAGAGQDAELDSGWPNFAVSAAMMMSQDIASSQPPPRAKPATAAITGLRQVFTRSQLR